jgi:oxaloacetate decarboxylase alpha subunit
MGPQEAYDLVKALKETVKVPIDLHTHSTTGLAPLTLLKAVEAGADIIDTSISSMSGGTSQYSTESMAYSLRQLGYEVDLNDDVLKEINDYYKPIKDNYIETGLLDPYVMGVQTDALTYQIPGGMLSNLIAQLKAQKSIDRLDEVLEETPKVRAEFGYPPLVTPMSQMVGVQAVSNVITGERYKNISNEVRAYVRGEYGTPPGEIDPEIVKIVLGDEKRITTRFADTLEPQFENFKKEIGEYAKTDEDVLSYALFPTVAENFLKKRTEEEENRATYTIVEA